MRVVTVPWNAWYADTTLSLSFPDTWDVTVAAMADAAAIDEQGIERALSCPFGTSALAQLAKDAATAAVVVEDITRPSPTAHILPVLLHHLEQGGIARSHVRIIIGTGAHVPPSRPDLLLKLGRAVVESVEVVQHHCYENLAHLGQTTQGTPIYINRAFLEMDLRIGVGTAIPHAYAGFGGGAKIVAIGIAGMDTVHANHSRVGCDTTAGSGRVEGNLCRADMEEIAERAGLRFVVNCVLNSRRELAGVFAGHPVHAHRSAVDGARQVYATSCPPPADIGIFNAYPKDIDLIQAPSAFNAVNQDIARAVKPGGSVVLMAACPHGLGYHQRSSIGGRCHTMNSAPWEADRRLLLFSPNLSAVEARQHYAADTPVMNEWGAVMNELRSRHGAAASVTVFPCGALQAPA
jgi:nickel-dependent lactate racemase